MKNRWKELKKETLFITNTVVGSHKKYSWNFAIWLLWKPVKYFYSGSFAVAVLDFFSRETICVGNGQEDIDDAIGAYCHYSGTFSVKGNSLFYYPWIPVFMYFLVLMNLIPFYIWQMLDKNDLQLCAEMVQNVDNAYAEETRKNPITNFHIENEKDEFENDSTPCFTPTLLSESESFQSFDETYLSQMNDIQENNEITSLPFGQIRFTQKHLENDLCDFEKTSENKHSGHHEESFDFEAHPEENLDEEDLTKINKFVDYMNRRISQKSNQKWFFSMFLFEIFVVLFWFLKILSLHVFLNGNYILVGISREDVFPKLSRCTFFKYGPSGGKETRDYFCVLPLNAYFEVFVVASWFVDILIATFLSLHFLLRSIQWHVYRYEIYNVLFGPPVRREDFVWILKLSYHDWLFISYLSDLITEHVYEEVVSKMRPDLHEKKQA